MFGHRILCPLFVCALFALVPRLAWADAGILGNKHWRICVGDVAVPPYVNNDPARLGLGERLLLDAGAQAGLSIELLRYPSRRCLQQLQRGELDALVAAPTSGNQIDAAFPQRDGLVDDSRRLGRLNVVWVRRRDSTLEWDGKSWAGSAPIDLLVGTRAGQVAIIEPLKKMGFRVDDAAFNAPQLLRKLLAKRVDLVAGLQEEIELAMLKVPAWRDSMHILPKPIFSSDFYVAIGKQSSPERRAQAEALWEAIGDLREGEKYRLR